MKPLSPTIKQLLDIVFGHVNPNTSCNHNEIVLPPEQIDFKSLDAMAHLMKVEFYASLQKEIANDEETVTTDVINVNPFDVYLVEPTFRNKNIEIAVVIPIKSGQKETFVWTWIDKNHTCWEPNELDPIRKVSSLSGTARVIDNLDYSTIPMPKLMQGAMDRANLFDITSLCDEAFDFNGQSNPDLNLSQNKAVFAVKSRYFLDGTFVVCGPPGTGKSTTLVEMIGAITNEGVIASAPSNAATANIALKLFKTGKYNILDICVFGSNCYESVRFLNPSIRMEMFGKLCKEIEWNAASKKRIAELIKKFASWLHQDVELTSYEDIRALCSAEEYCLENAKIVCCTLNTSGSNFLQRHCGKKGIYFLDEAGQCNEAEFYLATTFPGIRRVVVVGDPMQLPPTIIDIKCKNAGLGISWMERIQTLYPHMVHLLDTQYRMDPLILKFPNLTFYDNRIKCGNNVLRRLPMIKKPIGFIDTSKRSSEAREKFSTKNVQEACIIRALFRQDDDIRSLLINPETTVAIITPYSAQKILLETELRKVTNLKKYTVSTVDSYQGREADIVIISTVRTKSVGFVDDRQRINVALTRAKRLVRVVGCKRLFDRLGNDDFGRISTLRKLTNFMCNNNYSIDIAVKNNIYSFPDWRKGVSWKPTLTQRFHNALREMEDKDKAVVFNTLHAVATPNLHKLFTYPSNKSYWQITSIKGHEDNSIVWVGKTDDATATHFCGTIEAHFCGTKRACLQFKQTNITRLPMRACKVNADLSGIIADTKRRGPSKVTPSWILHNDLQMAIQNDNIEELPNGTFELDPEQSIIVNYGSPLLLESKAGTGKSLVLFQHAVNLSRALMQMKKKKLPILFITVSKRLSTQLEHMYKDVKNINNAAVSSCTFMSLSDLINELSKQRGIGKTVNDVSSFRDYEAKKKSYASLPVDRVTLENEIGGVILGSLESSILRRPLTWQEYERTHRSNLGKDSTTRRLIYDQYMLYEEWKRENNHFDINDLVLEIIQNIDGEDQQYFAGVYLDEIQDFSYAMIYLICSIGGINTRGDNTHDWVFAGDTAQMISPGCSFQFAGLKQTLLAIKPGIEKDLKKVQQLLINYRTTKDVLQVANAILTKAKYYFPETIEFARQEHAVNDFGIKVVLCDWDAALETAPSFGRDQAIIYSISDDTDDKSLLSLREWLHEHPFILSVLDSKGLEFDDIVVAFDMSREYWKIASREKIALKMLRELYVAVTRAKRRVIILVKKRADTMKTFLSNLEYNLDFHPDISKLFEEFKTCTDTHQWSERAKELFEEERYDLASRCYEKANMHGFAAWALGKHFTVQRDFMKARNSFFCASELLNDDKENNIHVLDVASDFLLVVSWEENPPKFIKKEIINPLIKMYPTHLQSNIHIKLSIYRDLWHNVNFKNIAQFKTIVNRRRNFPGLKKYIHTLSTTLTASELKDLDIVIPCIIGDMRCDKKEWIEAIKLYIAGDDFEQAGKLSLKLISILKRQKDLKPDNALTLAHIWRGTENCLPQDVKRIIVHLITLICAPEEASKKYPSQCLQEFGVPFVKFIVVEHRKASKLLLHSFCKKTFYLEVTRELKKGNSSIDVVSWFLDRKDEENAINFIQDNLSQWEDSDLRSFVANNLCTNDPMGQQCNNRELFIEAINVFLKCQNIEAAYDSANRSVSTIRKAEKNALRVVHMLQGSKAPKLVTPKIVLLRKLFNRPNEMDRNECKEAVKNFGVSVIQIFVLRKVNYTQQIQEGEQIKDVYRDVMDVLRMFGNSVILSRMHILQHYHKQNIQNTPFIDRHMKSWTEAELVKITNEFRYTYENLAREFLRRKLYVMAAQQFLGLDQLRNAVEVCEIALSQQQNPRPPIKFYLQLKNLWLTNKNEMKVNVNQLDPMRAKSLCLFLQLWQDPIAIATGQSKVQQLYCIQTFGASLIQRAVLTKYLLNPKKFDRDPADLLQKNFSIQKMSRLEVLKNLGKLTKKTLPIKEYAHQNINYWSDNIEMLKGDEIRLLLDLNVYPDKIESVLITREMYIETLKVYLDNQDIDKATDLSNHMISSESHIEEVIQQWEILFSKSSKAKEELIPQSCKLWLLLRLYNEPDDVSKSKYMCKQSISILGPIVVERAVLKRIKSLDEASKILLSIDPQYFERYRKKRHR